MRDPLSFYKKFHIEHSEKRSGCCLVSVSTCGGGDRRQRTTRNSCYPPTRTCWDAGVGGEVTGWWARWSMLLMISVLTEWDGEGWRYIHCH